MLQPGLPIRTASVEEMFLKDLPKGVTLLPHNFEGETTRVELKFSVSQQAVNNEKFDLKGFIKAKLDNTLTAIRHRRNIKELRLTRRLQVVIDPKSGHEKTQIYFYIEYANELHEFNELKELKIMAKKKKTTEECLAEVNDGIREGLRFWSDTMLRAEADEWAYKLNYFPTDLMNAVYIFQHVASNIGIKAGKIDEETAKVLGNQLRKLVIDMTGYDPHGILDDLKKDDTTN